LRKRRLAFYVYISGVREVQVLDPGKCATDPERGQHRQTFIRKQQKESKTMMKRANKPLLVVVMSVFVCTVALLGTADAQKASVPKAQDKLALGESEVRQLLVLMDTDKNGRVSKEQYMKFMEAEFERLDKYKNGELDVQELTKSTVTANRFVGK
jgi:hypothetical protein